MKDKENDKRVSSAAVDIADVYADNIKLNARQGHGFAAEKANNLYDEFSGKDAKIIGDDNKKDGADRVVDGQYIQTKYCQDASTCISESFREGRYRYINSDGTPMQLEVPPELYEEVVEKFREKIKNGEVPNVTDPNEANNIVRKGYFTREQAINIAKFGTVESLTFDAVNGIKLSSKAMCLTSLIVFATSCWSGKSKLEALEVACFHGLCVGGISFITHMVTSQVGKTGVDVAMRGMTIKISKLLPTDLKSFISEAARGESQKKLAGNALTNHFDKLLRSNAVAIAATTVVLSIDDFFDLFNKHISGKQAFKNIAKTSITVSGGALGVFIVGGIKGLPAGIPGAIITSCAALIGATIAKKINKHTIDKLIDDDLISITTLIEHAFCNLSNSYILSVEEFTAASKKFNSLNLELFVKQAYSSGDPQKYVIESIDGIIESIVCERPPVFMPRKKQINSMNALLINQ